MDYGIQSGNRQFALGSANLADDGTLSSWAGGDTGSGISPQDVKNALLRVLQSTEFNAVQQLRSFLTYVVRAELENRSHELKGYTIAVEALGRDESFDPISDPIVRVEAARLRRRLTKYYSGDGRDDPLRIVIPKGTYVPRFEPNEEAPSAKAAATDTCAPSKSLATPHEFRPLSILDKMHFSSSHLASLSASTGTLPAPAKAIGLLCFIVFSFAAGFLFASI